MSWSSLHACVHKHLKKSQLLPSGERLLLAVSGGQDSLCLGQLLLDLQPKWHWHLAIAHCDHGWSTDQSIADHMASVAKTWQLPFYLCTAESPVKEAENEARKWRYSQLITLAEKHNFSFLLTGHTLSDRAETFLFNTVRGGGAAGISALQWHRQLSRNVTLVRPLLALHRNKTALFCREYQLPIYEDVCNQNLKFARNRIRLNILPELKRINLQAERHLSQTADILQSENDYLAAITQEHFQQALDKKRLSRPSLQILHLALQRRVVRRYLQDILPTMPTFYQVSAVVELIRAPNRSQTSTFSGNCYFAVRGEWIVYSYID